VLTKASGLLQAGGNHLLHRNPRELGSYILNRDDFKWALQVGGGRNEGAAVQCSAVQCSAVQCKLHAALV
jgi:hypothetical protein